MQRSLDNKQPPEGTSVDTSTLAGSAPVCPFGVFLYAELEVKDERDKV